MQGVSDRKSWHSTFLDICAVFRNVFAPYSLISSFTWRVYPVIVTDNGEQDAKGMVPLARICLFGPAAQILWGGDNLCYADDDATDGIWPEEGFVEVEKSTVEGKFMVVEKDRCNLKSPSFMYGVLLVEFQVKFGRV